MNQQAVHSKSGKSMYSSNVFTKTANNVLQEVEFPNSTQSRAIGMMTSETSEKCGDLRTYIAFAELLDKSYFFSRSNMFMISDSDSSLLQRAGLGLEKV